MRKESGMSVEIATLPPIDHTCTASAAGSAIELWNPEDHEFWRIRGQYVARRNLVFSIFAEFLAFSVWQLWSILVVKFPALGFPFDTNQLFWLAAVPGLTGATLRIPYALAVSRLGGRNWTLISTALLLLPAIGIGYCVQDPHTSYGVFLTLALLCGFGGGSFASSMANINHFFPKRLKGVALGLNAAGGNIGVSVVQWLAPLAMVVPLFGAWGGAPQILSGTQSVWLQNVAWIWVPLIAMALLTTWFFMDNLPVAKASFKEQIPVFKQKHSWILSWMYLGTFGSFIGYSAGFPLLIKSQFAGVNPLQFAFLGPLVGAMIRPVGGWLADKFGGARVTFWNFILMTVATLGVVYFLNIKDQPGAFAGFFVMFMILFFAAGIGNGSIYRMVPVIFLTLRQRKQATHSVSGSDLAQLANKEAGVAIGLTSAIAAYGAFFVPKSYGSAIALTGTPQMALLGFVGFYVTCLVINWWFYFRRRAEIQC